jgi:hypothetical protein
MTLYFSVAVWLSIALIHAPVPESRRAAGEQEGLRLTLARVLDRAAL